MRVDDSATLATAAVGMFLFGSLALICFYQAYQFWEVMHERLTGGYYAKPKFIFFMVMAFSCIFEIPIYLGCVIAGGPTECNWDEDKTHNLAWCSHILATSGFTYTVTSTAVLWSDVIQRKDGNFFYSEFPLDKTKVFFRVAWVLYTCIAVIAAVSATIEHCTKSHSNQHAHSAEVGTVMYCLIPLMLALITMGCFIAGFRLERHVLKRNMDAATLGRIIFNMNITMFIIASSYILRALLILSLYAPMPRAYTSVFSTTWHYSVWIPVTQWFAYWFCSLCLVEQMRYRPADRRPDSIVKTGQLELQQQQDTDAESVKERTISHDSTVSDMDADSRSSASSARSSTRIMHIGADSRHRAIGYLMSQLEDATAAAAAPAGPGVPPQRPSGSGSNYFDRMSGGMRNDPSKKEAFVDHFFTTSALHSRGSTATTAGALSLSAGNAV